MTQAVAFSILALTVSLSLKRPTLGRVRIHHSSAAVIGALLCVISGTLPWPLVVQALQFLFFPVVTIVSLMTITLIADHAGLFELLAKQIARAAGGDGKKLFAYLFFAGTLTGTIFTNDAAVLIFTPLVFKLIEEVQGDDWTVVNKIPFYFAVLYVANVVGALVISNPINIIVCSFFGISFLDYAAWMFFPALVSILTTFFGLRWFFRKAIPERFVLRDEASAALRNPTFLFVSGVVLGLTMMAFFTEGVTGIPTWVTALCGALTLLAVHVLLGQSHPAQIIRGIGWDVIVFVVGIFIVANGLRNVGLTGQVAGLIRFLSGSDPVAMKQVTGFTAAISSSIMNNHPTADMMGMVIRDLNLPLFETKMLVFAALIGGDLGPKMLPIGSLAALLWFRMLRDRGIDVPYRLYIIIGIPVTLAAIFLSIVMLNIEVWVYQALGP
ncbi:hypothetical protein AYO44_09695 [Planctomycetaceae bacterium SCGC AG-212-F19]|nr:hypothetical protein AYO44_09695 [Planctomycetaceae bacterium SCGC AG-212-F19]